MKYTKFIFNILLALTLLMPAVSLAQIIPSGPGGTPPIFGGSVGGSSIQDGLDQVPSELKGGRFGSAQTVTDVIVEVIYVILGIAGAVAVLFVVIGGFLYLTAGGSPEQVKKGKAYLVNALIGVIIILLSYVVVNVVVNQLS